MRIPGVLRVASAAALLLVAGCAERGSASPDPSPPLVHLPEDGDAVLLRVEHVGGFMTPAATVSRLPLSSLYADGRLITEGPVDAIYPGPALPNVQVRRLDAAVVQELADRAVAAGVTEPGDLGRPPIADAPSTRFSLATADGTVVREVYALAEYRLGADQAESHLTEEQAADRARLRELTTALFEAGQQPTGDGRVPVESYVPAAVAAVASPWIDPGDGLAHPEQPWPGPALPGKPVGGSLGVGCVVATGDAANAALAAAAAANAATPWVSGGSLWSVQFRPLLPDESGCADLAD